VHLTLPNHSHYVGATRTPVLVTVHDLCHLACPEYQTRASNLTLSVGLDRAVETGASFLSVSEATRQQMLRAYGLDPSRVATVPIGCREGLFHPVFDPGRRAEARRRYGLPEVPFLLTLSTLEPRKNLVGTVRAFEILRAELGVDDVVLVIAGPRGWKSGELMRAVARNRERIHLPGFIDDADLAAVYSSAAGFVYASHYEGFGLPLLEAMRCGAAVVYGDNSSMPELVGDAGLPVDSRDPRAIARQLRRLLREEGLARELGRRALARSQEFTWQRTAADTARVYEQRVRGAGAPERRQTGTS
jgi:glycosyltransferase involved in cell wall biosynthesis